MTDPASWALLDLERQQSHFEETGKTAKFDPPPKSLFECASDWDEAFRLQKKYCTKPHHLGDRRMPRSLLTQLNECKQCKSLKGWSFETPPLSLPCTFVDFEKWVHECIVRRFADDANMQKFSIPVDNMATSTFASADEYASAKKFIDDMSKTKFFCTHAQHSGSRFFGADQSPPQNKWQCRPCFNLAQRERNRCNHPVHVYSTAEDWFASKAHPTSAQLPDIVGHCPVPKRDQLASDEEFEKAKALQLERSKEYHRQYAHKYNAQAHRVAHDKKRQHDAYLDTKNDPEKYRQKLDRGNASHEKRKEEAFSHGRGWCIWGSHSVDVQDMHFCPVDDLGLEQCSAGAQAHKVCKHHFLAYWNSTRTFEARFKDRKRAAARRGIEWHLSEEEAMPLFGAARCHTRDAIAARGFEGGVRYAEGGRVE